MPDDIDGHLAESRKTVRDMTHSLSTLAATLLSPGRLERVADLRDSPALIPQAGGVYAWWFVKEPPGVPVEGTVLVDGFRLLYVGIAPRKPSSTEQGGKRTLRDRLLNHCRGPIGSSTLRRTLATLLAQTLDLQIGRLKSGRIGMRPEDEARLTGWMQENAKVNWVTCAEPWELEDHLIAADARLPLNIRGSADPFAKVLSAKRSQLFSTRDLNLKEKRDRG